MTYEGKQEKHTFRIKVESYQDAELIVEVTVRNKEVLNVYFVNLHRFYDITKNDRNKIKKDVKEFLISKGEVR